MTRSHSRTATLLLAVGLAAAPALAQSGSVLGAADLSPRARPISGRTVITQPGSYTVARNITNDTTAPTILIQANDVSLDLGGFRLLGAVATPAGVAVMGASNVRIRNGAIRGFGVGVRVENSSNVVVTGLQIDGRDTPSPAPSQREIGVLLVNSRGIEVSHNVITDGFLGIFVRGEESGGNRISDNLITGGDNGELGICYNPAPGAAAGGPHGDLVYNNVISRWRRGLSLSSDSTGNFIRENTLAYFDLGLEDETPPGSNVVAENDALQILR